MPSLAVTTKYGFRTPTAFATAKYYDGIITGDALHVVAGKASDGLINGTARPVSVQFGTGATDALANTAVTATAANMLGGSVPSLVQTDAAGNQSLGYGRVTWTASTKFLRVMQKADDALVSNCPRCQVWFHPMLNKSAYYRYVLHMRFGDAQTPWPAWSAGKNAILVFQIKGDLAAFPPFNLQLRDATNGNQAMRDLVFLRRRDNTGSVTPGAAGDGLIADGSGEDYVCVIPNITPGDLQRIAIDFRPDWQNAAEGGSPYLAIWYGGVKQALHAHVGGGTEMTTKTVYPITAAASGNDIYQAMVGIYRPSYQGAKAPNDCAVVFERAEVQQFYTVPDWPPLAEA